MICFLPILLIYYPLLMLGIDQAKSGRMPYEVVWLGKSGFIDCWLVDVKKVERY